MTKAFSDCALEYRVLAILSKNKKLLRSDFTKTFGINYITVKSALENLEDMGLTKYEALGDRRDTVYWSLTDKGKKAAEMLSDLDEFIRNC